MNEALYAMYQRCILNILLQYRVDLAFDDWGANTWLEMSLLIAIYKQMHKISQHCNRPCNCHCCHYEYFLGMFVEHRVVKCFNKTYDNLRSLIFFAVYE